MRLRLFFIFLIVMFILSFFGTGLFFPVSLRHLFDNFFTFAPFLLTGGLLIYFLISVLKKSTVKTLLVREAVEEKVDEERRQFLKTLGSLGLGGLFYFLLTRKAQAIQFGGTGVPDPIGIEPLGNSQTTGSVTLTDANTWYQVPASNQANRVFLVVHNRSGYDMYWTFDDTVSASTGGLLLPSGGTLQFDAGSAVKVYVRCETAGQVCWYAESQSQ